jgi:hypothetical protein
MTEKRELVETGFDDGHAGHQRRQARLGLSMTPAERLAWLERKTAEMRGLLGRAHRDGQTPTAREK